MPTLDQNFSNDLSDKIDVLEIIINIWRNKKLIFLVTTFFTFIGILYALLATPVYHSEAIISPKESQKGGGSAAILSQFGGLGGMMATQLGMGNTNIDRMEIYLKGRDIAEKVILSETLMPYLFPGQWDFKRNKWKTADSSKIPTLRSGIERLRTHWLSIVVNKKSNTLTVGINTYDAVLAGKTVSSYLIALNEKVREDIIRDAKSNRDYLDSNLSQTTDPAVRDKIQTIIAGELERMMLVNSKCFDVLEKPIVPDMPVKPKKFFSVFLMMMAGIFISLMSVFARPLLTKAINNLNTKS